MSWYAYTAFESQSTFKHTQKGIVSSFYILILSLYCKQYPNKLNSDMCTFVPDGLITKNVFILLPILVNV